MRFAAAVLVVLLLCIPCYAIPMTRVVPGDYPTIQGAIDASSDGDIVSVSPGMYNGDVFSVSNITLHFDPTTVIEGQVTTGVGTDIIAHGDLTIVSGGDITFGGTVDVAGKLELHADGNIAISNTVNALEAIIAAGESIYITAPVDGGLSVDISAGTDVTGGEIVTGGSVIIVVTGGVVLPIPTVILVPADHPTIQAGINAAAPGDTVVVADGVYTGDGNRDIDFLGKSIIVKSENGPENCTINCQGSEGDPHRAFYFHNNETNDSVLDGVKIINGYAETTNQNFYGGAIFCDDSSPTIRNCVVTDCYAWYGGGIGCSNSNVVIENCHLYGNEAKWRGGGLKFTGHSVPYYPKVFGCIINDNGAFEDGGGIHVQMNGKVLIEFSTIIRNAEKDSPVSTRDVYGGGAMCVLRGNVTMSHCILWGNTSFSSSGGSEIFVANSGYQDNEWDVSNIVLSYCNLTPCDLDNSRNRVVTFKSGSKSTLSYNGILFADPMLENPDENDFHLKPISPCINAGDSEGDYEGLFDIDGENRLMGERVDIGVDEYESKTIYVYVDGSGDFETIQSAVDAAGNGDEVIVTDGVYTGEGNRNINLLGKSITVRSENGAGSCIIDCQKLHRGFRLQSGEGSNTVLDGFTVINGNATRGGGIKVQNSSPIIQNCIIRSCESEFGGGMYFGKSYSASIKNCKSIDNIAHFGGGMFNLNSRPNVTNCMFSGNISESGGGMYSEENSSPRLINCTFAGNSAEDGSGIYSTESCPIVINCILWDNIANNENEINGIASVSYSCIQGGYAGTDNINVDPIFVDADGDDDLLGTEDDNLRLQAGSLCIDVGDNSVVAAGSVDLDGNARIFNGVVDMGAYELFNTAPVADAGDDIEVFTDSACVATVMLDGSGSSDEDDDELTYSWYIGDVLIADGETPSVELGGGEHTITLIVNDGTEDSEPDDVAITVICNAKPISDAGDDVGASVDEDCVATVMLDGSASMDADGDELTYSWYYEGDLFAEGMQVEAEVGLGEHEFTLIVNDGVEDSAADTMVVTVIDDMGPEFSVVMSKLTLWPANNKMVKVTPIFTASDNCGGEVSIELVGVTCNQEVKKGKKNKDIEIDGDDIYLRATRDGKDKAGRVYTITYIAADEAGNETIAEAKVTVPHDMGKRRPRPKDKHRKRRRGRK